MVLDGGSSCGSFWELVRRIVADCVATTICGQGGQF